MNSYFAEAQSGFYGNTGAPAGADYRFPIGLGGLGSMSPYGNHQPRPPQDTSYDTPASPSKASSLYSSLTDTAAYSSKIDCKEQNGYANIKPDIGAAGSMSAGWGASAPGVRSTTTPEMTRYTPSSVDQAARDRAWMNTCSSLSAAAQATQSPPQLQQPSAHQTFYPWMAIADFPGKSSSSSIYDSFGLGGKS